MNDRESAYKHHPPQTERADLAAVSLPLPADGRIYGCAPLTQIFGSGESVGHYNMFSRIMVTITNKVLGIPVWYVGDFAYLSPLSIGPAAMQAFHQMADIVGVRMKKAKCSLGQTNTFLGVDGSMPETANNILLPARLPDGKSAKWAESIQDFPTSDATERAWMDKIVGRLSFTQSLVFGRFARTLMRPLYRKLKARGIRPKRICHRARMRFLEIPAPTMRHPFNTNPDFALHTYASLEFTRGVLAAVLFKEKESRTPVDERVTFRNASLNC